MQTLLEDGCRDDVAGYPASSGMSLAMHLESPPILTVAVRTYAYQSCLAWNVGLSVVAWHVSLLQQHLILLPPPAAAACTLSMATTAKIVSIQLP